MPSLTAARFTAAGGKNFGAPQRLRSTEQLLELGQDLGMRVGHLSAGSRRGRAAALMRLK
jgi:hypothetical protein